MTRKTLASVLLVVFGVSLVGNFAWMVHKLSDTSPDDIDSLIAAIAQAHSIFIAMLIGLIFSDQRKIRSVDRSVSFLAICLCMAWVLLFSECWVGYVTRFNASGPGGLVDQMNRRATEASFLVAGMLGYVCGAPADK